MNCKRQKTGRGLGTKLVRVGAYYSWRYCSNYRLEIGGTAPILNYAMLLGEPGVMYNNVYTLLISDRSDVQQFSDLWQAVTPETREQHQTWKPQWDGSLSMKDHCHIQSCPTLQIYVVSENWQPVLPALWYSRLCIHYGHTHDFNTFKKSWNLSCELKVTGSWYGRHV